MINMKRHISAKEQPHFGEGVLKKGSLGAAEEMTQSQQWGTSWQLCVLTSLWVPSYNLYCILIFYILESSYKGQLLHWLMYSWTSAELMFSEFLPTALRGPNSHSVNILLRITRHTFASQNCAMSDYHGVTDLGRENIPLKKGSNMYIIIQTSFMTVATISTQGEPNPAGSAPRVGAMSYLPSSTTCSLSVPSISCSPWPLHAFKTNTPWVSYILPSPTAT